MREWTAEEMGRKGGKKSKRVLSAKEARDMVLARERKRKEKLEANIDARSEKEINKQ